MGESRDGLKPQFPPILRSGNGNFFGFGEPEAPGADERKGRVAQILPAQVPDDGLRKAAKAMLKVKGVKVGPSSKSPRLPRFRR